MSLLRLSFFLAISASLAGCAFGGAGGSEENTDGTKTTKFSMDALGAGPGPLAPEPASIDAPANATALLVEARWTCTTPVCDISLVLTDPDGNEAGAHGGNASATIRVLRPIEGTYTLAYSTAAPVAGIDGEVRATVFLDEMPDDFTAWGPTSARG